MEMVWAAEGIYTGNRSVCRVKNRCIEVRSDKAQSVLHRDYLIKHVIGIAGAVTHGGDHYRAVANRVITKLRLVPHGICGD